MTKHTGDFLTCQADICRAGRATIFWMLILLAAGLCGAASLPLWM